MNDSDEKYYIAAAIFRIPIPVPGLKIFTHNFWVLKNDKNVTIAALHGLATSPQGEILPVGYFFEHRLKAYYCVYDNAFKQRYRHKIDEETERNINLTYSLEENALEKIYDGEDTLDRWFRGVACVNQINRLNLPYPPGGFFGHTKNSNTIYHTFADRMGLPCHEFEGYQAVGIGNTLTDFQPQPEHTCIII